MTVIAKTQIEQGSSKNVPIIVPKGTQGTCLAISKSYRMHETFPRLGFKTDGWYYICRFSGVPEEVLCSLFQIELRT